MTWYEIIGLCVVLVILLGFFAYEMLQEKRRHDAWIAERNAQIALYKTLLDELRKAR